MLRIGILLVLQDVEKLNSNELGTKEVIAYLNILIIQCAYCLILFNYWEAPLAQECAYHGPRTDPARLGILRPPSFNAQQIFICLPSLYVIRRLNLYIL